MAKVMHNHTDSMLAVKFVFWWQCNSNNKLLNQRKTDSEMLVGLVTCTNLRVTASSKEQNAPPPPKKLPDINFIHTRIQSNYTCVILSKPDIKNIR